MDAIGRLVRCGHLVHFFGDPHLQPSLFRTPWIVNGITVMYEQMGEPITKTEQFELLGDSGDFQLLHQRYEETTLQRLGDWSILKYKSV